MFRRIASNVPGGANKLFLEHPSVITTMLEVAWQYRAHGPDLDLGTPGHRSNIPQLPDIWLEPLQTAAKIVPPSGSVLGLGVPSHDRRSQESTVLWDHLIYAYMIENTVIYEIFGRVLHEYLYGEKLDAPTAAAQHWLRNTEELFYRDPPPFFITSITSHIRPDMRGSRRNAYQRMFGMDLNHGKSDGQPYSYIKATAHNNAFVSIFEEFLRESWIAIANIGNSSGPDPTDRGKLINLIENLNEMLLTRRINGNLSREEFVFVSMMSWFHLTVSSNFPIIESLKAAGTSPEQRLRKIAERVGLPAHGLSKSLFDIADPISRILILIETGGLSTLPAKPAAPFAPTVQDDLNTIITHWSLITGRDMKARKVATVQS